MREILPFALPPAAVCYVIPRTAFDEVGGWCEEFRLGGAEGVDLCFKMWVCGKRILLDERVLIEHHSKGTAGSKLENWQEVWRANRELLLDRWSAEKPICAGIDDELRSLLEDLKRGAGREPEAEEAVSRLEKALAERAQRAAEERARLASGVAWSWRELDRQRQIAIGLRRSLAQSIPRQVYRRYRRKPLDAVGVMPWLKRLLRGKASH